MGGFRFMRHFLSISALLVFFALSACGGVESEAKYPTGMDRSTVGDSSDIYAEPDSIFGAGGLNVFGKGDEDDSGGGAIGVNSYLWRASLDTVSFMPLASADPFGGVILTDWYSAAEKPDERIKLNVFILDKQLRSDGIQVKVFRQVKKGGEWRDASVADETGRSIEDAILTRARQMRVAKVGSPRE